MAETYLEQLGYIKNVEGKNGNAKYNYTVKNPVPSIPGLNADTVDVYVLSPNGQTHIDNLSRPSLDKSNWMEYVWEDSNPEGKWLSAPRDFSSLKALLKTRDKVRELIEGDKCGGKVEKGDLGMSIAWREWANDARRRREENDKVELSKLNDLYNPTAASVVAQPDLTQETSIIPELKRSERLRQYREALKLYTPLETYSDMLKEYDATPRYGSPTQLRMPVTYKDACGGKMKKIKKGDDGIPGGIETREFPPTWKQGTIEQSFVGFPKTEFGKNLMEKNRRLSEIFNNSLFTKYTVAPLFDYVTGQSDEGNLMAEVIPVGKAVKTAKLATELAAKNSARLNNQISMAFKNRGLREAMLKWDAELLNNANRSVIKNEVINNKSKLTLDEILKDVDLNGHIKEVDLENLVKGSGESVKGWAAMAGLLAPFAGLGAYLGKKEAQELKTSSNSDKKLKEVKKTKENQK